MNYTNFKQSAVVFYNSNLQVCTSLVSHRVMWYGVVFIFDIIFTKCLISQKNISFRFLKRISVLGFSKECHT